MAVEFFLGGARSGKSSYAERIALDYLSARSAHPCPPMAGQSSQTPLADAAKVQLHYVATAIAFDREMAERITHHQARRGAQWQNHECPLELATLLASFTERDIVLIDCLTLWMNNVIYNHGQTASAEHIAQQVAALTAALSQSPATILCVSNEVGLGIVPLGEVSRLYVDHAGWMNQAVAALATRVTFLAAGLPLVVKHPNMPSARQAADE